MQNPSIMYGVPPTMKAPEGREKYSREWPSRDACHRNYAILETGVPCSTRPRVAVTPMNPLFTEKLQLSFLQ